MIEKVIGLVPWRLRDRIRRIPGVAAAQRWVFRKFFDGVEQDHRIDAGPARGLVFPIRLPEDKLFWTGTWEVEFAERLAEEVKAGFVCLDVGSYRGYFAGLMAVRGAKEVHCFEPNPDNFRRVRRMIELNAGHNLKLHELALGEAEAEAEFVLMPEQTMGKLANSEFQKQADGGRRISVPVATLDGLTSRGEVPRPDLIKVDIEGAEWMFLNGARQCLQQDRPVVLLEYHSGDLARECAKYLERLDYEVELLEASELADLQAESVGHFIARPR